MLHESEDEPDTKADPDPDAEAERKGLSIQNADIYRRWMCHYIPQVAYTFTMATEQQQADMTEALFGFLDIRCDRDNTYETVQECLSEELRLVYAKYLDLSIYNMLEVHGYSRISKRAKNTGAWSTLIDIHAYRGRSVRLVAKIMTTHDHTNEPILSGVCYNEIMVAKQVICSNTTPFHDVIIVGSTKPRLAMGTVCFIQTRYDRDLHSALKRDLGMASPKDICMMIWNIASGLHALHDQQFVHLDIKPQNILTNDNDLRLCDYGLTIRVTTQRRMEARKVTFWYRPPELMAACLQAGSVFGTFDTSVDVWSAGMVLWDIMFTQPLLSIQTSPFDYEDPRHVEKALVFLGERLGVPHEAAIDAWGLPPHLHVTCREIFKKCTTDRYHSLHGFKYRPSIKSMPHEFLDQIQHLVWTMLDWNPHTRISASMCQSMIQTIMGQMQKTQPRLIIPTHGLHRARCIISPAERTWRRTRYEPHDVASLWDRTVPIVRFVCKNMGAEFDVDTHMSDYLDVIVLSCELYMRAEYAEFDGDSLFDPSALHSACVNLALQITRPFVWSHIVYTQLHQEAYKMQQIEQYIAYLLDFRLYTENIVTALSRQYPRQLIPYNQTKNMYITQCGTHDSP